MMTVRSCRQRPSPLLGLVLLASTLTIPALTGCDASDGSAAVEAVRDTLPDGVERVRYGPLPPEEPQSLFPDLSIGVLEGDPNFVFGDVRGIEVGTDGAIYVLDFQAAELRAFEPDGSFRRTVAREGGGPGEIRQANGLARAPDGTFWVQDHGQWQLLRLTPEGDEVSRMPMFVRQYGYLWDGMVDESGRIWTSSAHSLTQRQGPPEAGVNEAAAEHHLVSHDPPSGSQDTIQLGTVETHSYVVPLEGGWSFRPIPFRASLLSAVDPAGAVWVAMSDAYRIARLNARGDTTLVIEVDLPPSPVTAEDHAEFVQAARERDPEEERFAREIIRVMPETKPVLGQLVVDDRSRLWVRRFQEEDDPAHFDVFDPTGDYLTSVRLGVRTPPHFPPRIRDGRLHTLAVDDLDVPSVVRVELPFPDR